jgi:DNA-directed RNA polymerase specialized sigma24 family protein
VIVTRYWLGWSEAEIAQALNCRPGTVKSLASRALSQLRQEIRP